MRRLVPSMVVAALALVPMVQGCTSEPSPWVKPRRVEGGATAAAVVVPQMRVEFGGCEAVLLSEEDELQCVYEPGKTLRLWVTHEKSQSPEFAMEGDGAWSMGEPYVLAEELGQGYRLELEGDGLKAVTVTLPERPQWRLALRAKGELSEDETVLAEDVTKRAVKLERRLMKGELDAIPEARVLVDDLIAKGRLSAAIGRGAAFSYHLTWKAGRPKQGEDFIKETRERLERRFPEFDLQYSDGSAALSIYLGHTLERRGQLVAAAHEYRRGARVSRRVDDVLRQVDVLAPYAILLANLGYFEAAAYWSTEAREVGAEHARPFQLTKIMSQVAEVSLLLREAHRVHEDPAPRHAQIEKMYGRGGIIEEYTEPFDILLSRAEFALAEQKPEEVLSDLDRLQDEPAHRKAKIEELRLRALLQMGVSHQRLRKGFERFEAAAAHALGPELRWRVAVLEGRLLEELGEPDEALAAYARAEGLLDRLMPLATLGLPGSFAAARHGGGTDRLVSLLAERGRLEDAVCTIRRSHARVSQMALLQRRADVVSRDDLSATIEHYNTARQDYEELLEDSSQSDAVAREAARLSAAQYQAEFERHLFEILSAHGGYRGPIDCLDLDPRHQGELLLLLESEGADLHIFVEDGEGVTRFPSLLGFFESRTSDDWQSDLLLHPMRERLARARSIRVLSSGRASEIPVHALPWSADARVVDRKPLIQSKPVVYGLELPIFFRRDDASREALVLADGFADGANVESAGISASLRKHGWDVAALRAGDMDANQIRRMFGSVEHFHYAGHAYFDEGPGRERVLADGDAGDHLRRWPPYSGGAAREPSYIPLGGNGGRLTVPDILVMDRVPRTVVLMGCTTGVADERMAWGGFSLATAFLGAGAEAVVASTHRIDGNEASALSRAIYEGIESSDGNASRWMTDALNLLERRGDPMPSIEHYRVYVP